jgi:hypothetical protein
MLARQLRQCEHDGIVERRVYPEVPPKVEYTLTERGRSLAAILQQLATWAERDVSPHRLSLSVLPGRYSVCRLDAATSVPPWATQGHFFSVTGTAEELSMVCETAAVPPGTQSSNDWRALAVHGPLDFDAVGILAELSGRLANASVSIFAISTYDTDYLLVREGHVSRAACALRAAGHSVVEGTNSVGKVGRRKSGARRRV